MNSLLVHTISKRRKRKKENDQTILVFVSENRVKKEKKENEQFLPLTIRVSKLAICQI
jgi:hypothetical protein